MFAFLISKICLNVIFSKHANTLNVTTLDAIAYLHTPIILLSQQFQENIAEHG